jgi:ribosomal protein L37AE/L43A
MELPKNNSIRSKKPWQTVAWKKARDEFLKHKVCEKCGSDENLSVHHLQKFPSFDEHFRIVASSLIREAIELKEIQPEFKNACPQCKFRSIRRRKTVKPNFKCMRCGNQFDEPVLVPTDRLSKEDYINFLIYNKEKIENIVESERDSFFQKEYLQFKDCAVLCKKCHFLIHNRRDICPICKKNSKKIHFPSCWECFQKTPKGEQWRRDEEKYKESKRIMDEHDAFVEMADKAYELEDKGDFEGAKKLEREFYRKYRPGEEYEESY